MIKLSRVNDEDFYLNELYIESVQVNSDRDTVVKLHNGTTYTVKNGPEQILELVAAWNRRVAVAPPAREADATAG